MIGILLFAVTTCSGHGDFGEIDDPTSQELANAFLLTFAAGMSTVVGAAVAFMLREEDVKRERSTFLAGCLSFAAAVMIYVSFVEIWPESLSKYQESLASHDSHDHHSEEHHSEDHHSEDHHSEDHHSEDHHSDEHHDEGNEQVAHIYTSLTFFGGIILGYICTLIVKYFEQRQEGSEAQETKHQDVEMTGKDVTAEDSQSSSIKVTGQEERRKALLRTGIVTAASIAMHNFPEGLVTFFAALSDWDLGVATAFAIAIHNIPEGISIAVPYYYASESRWKAFVLAFLSGIAEPIGALIGWAIINDIWGDAAFGVMFGITAGIMVYISFHELLPLARKNDPSDKVTTIMIFVGMFVMDLSLFIGH